MGCPVTNNVPWQAVRYMGCPVTYNVPWQVVCHKGCPSSCYQCPVAILKLYKRRFGVSGCPHHTQQDRNLLQYTEVTQSFAAICSSIRICSYIQWDSDLQIS